MSDLLERERKTGDGSGIQDTYDKKHDPTLRSKEKNAAKDWDQNKIDDEFGKIASGSDQNSSSLYSPKSSSSGSKNSGRRSFFKRSRNRLSVKKKMARRAVIGVVAAAVIGLFGAFSSLLPLKAAAIIGAVQDQVSEVAHDAIEERMDRLMTRYLIRKAVEREVGQEVAESALGPLVTGNGPISDLYKNWQNARLEIEFQNEFGFQVVPKANGQDLRLLGAGTNPDNFELRRVLPDGSIDTSSNGVIGNINTKEYSDLIKVFSERETSRKGVIRRGLERRFLRDVRGIQLWRTFEPLDNARNETVDARRQFRTSLVDNTLGRIPGKTGVWLNCILDANPGSGGCSSILRRNPDTTIPGGDNDPIPANQEDADRITQSDADARQGGGFDSADTPELAQGAAGSNTPDNDRLLAKIAQKITLRKVIASFAGLGIIDTLSSVVDAVDSGALSIVIYDKNTTAYSGFAATIAITNDQIKAGQVTDEEAAVFFESLNNVEESPVFQSLFANSPQPETVSRICQIETRELEDGTIEIVEEIRETLAEGELVCPDKKVTQNPEASVEELPGWDLLVEINGFWKSNFGRIFSGLEAIVGGITSALNIDDFISFVLKQTGVTSLIVSGAERIFNAVIGTPLTGLEVGADLFDATVAGLQGSTSETAGVNFGAGLVPTEQQLVVLNEEYDQELRTFANRPFSERLLALDSRHSTSSKVLSQISTTNLNAGFGGFIRTLASLPKISFVALTSNTAYAQSNGFTETNINPFGNLIYGWDPAHEVFTANDGLGLTPEEVQNNPQWQCDNPDRLAVAEENNWIREPTQAELDALGINIGFEVMLENDPCALDQAVAQIGSAVFDPDAVIGLEQNSSLGSGFALGDIILEGDSSGVPCADGQEGTVVTGHNRGTFRLCTVEGIQVNSQLSGSLAQLIADARLEGFDFANSFGGRTVKRTEELRVINGCPGVYSGSPSECRIPTAIPGTSWHETGLAIDFRLPVNASGSQTLCFSFGAQKTSAGCQEVHQACVAAGDTTSARCQHAGAANWLLENGSRYGFNPLASEAWHFSPNGR